MRDALRAIVLAVLLCLGITLCTAVRAEASQEGHSLNFWMERYAKFGAVPCFIGDPVPASLKIPGDTRQIMVVCFKDQSWSLLALSNDKLWYVLTKGLGYAINTDEPKGKGKDL